MDENTKKWLKVLWAITILFLTVSFGAGGGCAVGFMIPQPRLGDASVSLGLFGAMVGFAIGCGLVVRVWRWFDKR